MIGYGSRKQNVKINIFGSKPHGILADFYVIKHISAIFWRFCLYIYNGHCTFAALTINDVCHRRMSVGYPLDIASGYFYAR